MLAAGVAPPLPVVVDRHALMQILINLLRNALQALVAANLATPRLTLGIAAAAEHVRISVTDNGVGIAAENLVRIFSHGFTTRKDGHGFGLHSSVLAARALCGDLTVHSNGLGAGACFTLELPVNAGANHPVGGDGG